MELSQGMEKRYFRVQTFVCCNISQTWGEFQNEVTGRRPCLMHMQLLARGLAPNTASQNVRSQANLSKHSWPNLLGPFYATLPPHKQLPGQRTDSQGLILCRHYHTDKALQGNQGDSGRIYQTKVGLGGNVQPERWMMTLAA